MLYISVSISLYYHLITVVYPPINWETTVVSCGSNAFGQLYHGSVIGGGGDLMSSLLKSTVLPLPLDGTLRVEALSCGHTLTAAIVCHESDLGLDYRYVIYYSFVYLLVNIRSSYYSHATFIH
jgi:hypothetical protein